jgi:uncharacterized alkaline shock family protein YloU
MIEMGESKKGYFKKSDEKGSINISEEVITVIVATAAVDVEGVHGLFVSHGREITQVSGKRGLYKGVRLSNDNNKLNIDVYVIAKMGYPVNELGENVQKAVVSSVEAAAGIEVNEINVHICGVALKKAKPAMPAVFSSQNAPPKKEAPKKAAEKKVTEKKTVAKKTPRAKKTSEE